MKIEFWSKPMDPPAGFELGEPPTDFGVGRCAYKYRVSKTGEQTCDGASERVLELAIWRGDAVLTHKDGSVERLGSNENLNSLRVLNLLKEVAADGLEIIGG